MQHLHRHSLAVKVRTQRSLRTPRDARMELQPPSTAHAREGSPLLLGHSTNPQLTLLPTLPGEKSVAEQRNKAKAARDGKILVLLCKGGEESLVRSELDILTSKPTHLGISMV